MKKRTLIILIVVISLRVVIISIHVIHAIFVDRKVKYHHITYESESLPQELDGYQIIFIADIHDCTKEQLEKSVLYLSQLDVDLILLGGDYTLEKDLDETLRLLASIPTKDGIYGVDGNHDKANRLFQIMNKYGIIPLDNSGVHVQENLYIAGVQDLWNRNPNIEKALSDVEVDDFVILITHNPDLVMKQSTINVDLTLAGHTHGGEISFFGIWEPIFFLGKISEYDQRFSGGWAKTNDHTDIYITTGLGKQFIRVFAQPEIVIITLKAK